MTSGITQVESLKNNSTILEHPSVKSRIDVAVGVELEGLALQPEPRGAQDLPRLQRRAGTAGRNRLPADPLNC